MKLEVRLFAGLTCKNAELSCSGKSEFDLDVPDGITVGALRRILAIEPALPLMTIVNNCHEQEERVLEESDRIGMFPPIGGG